VVELSDEPVQILPDSHGWFIPKKTVDGDV